MPARRKSRAGTRSARPAPASSLMEVFDGARRCGFGGMFFLPGVSLDTSKTMPQLTRQTIAKKSVLGYNNIPELRAVNDGLAIDEVDTALWPKARTSNRKFNKAVTDRFHEENSDPRTFDLRQVESIYSAQFLIRRTVRLVGDMFGQFIRPTGPDFLGRLTPSVSFLPGHQCTSDDARDDDKQIRDGIRFDRDTGAPAKYRFLNPGSSPATYSEIAANDVLHFHDPFLTDQIRGMSAWAPAVEDFFSMREIDGAETTGQIIRSGVAFAMETTGEDVQIPRLPGVVDTEIIENPDKTKTVIQKIRTREGREVQVYTPPSGMKIKTLESNRGGALEYRNHLARKLAHCSIYPPEWTLFVAGLGQGTVYRGVQNRVQKIANFLRSQPWSLEGLVSRWFIFWLWKRIQAGVFDSFGVPDDWFAHKIIYPANMSVDLGREGRLYADLVATGKMSWSDYHSLFGRDDEDVDEELVDKAIRRKILLKEKVAEAQAEYPGLTLDFNEIWKSPPGTALVAGGEVIPTHGQAVPEDGSAKTASTTRRNGRHARA